DPQALVDSNQRSLLDYSTRIPGVSVNPAPGGGGATILAVRRITTRSGTNPTVGVTGVDVPYGASTTLGGGYTLPDIDPSDLARIEVLRGPQGTLYGASSMGGLLKFVTIDPSTEKWAGRVQAGLSDTYNASDPGYNFRASLNAPVGE